MTASDTPEPWPNPLSDKLVAWRQRADMGSSFPPDIVLVLLDALTAARARIEQLEGALHRMLKWAAWSCDMVLKNDQWQAEAKGLVQVLRAALAQPPAAAPVAESGPPILPHNPEHEATVDALVARRVAGRGTDSSEEQSAGHSAYDTKRCPACNDNGRACAWCGEDGPTGEGQPAKPTPALRALLGRCLPHDALGCETCLAEIGDPPPLGVGIDDGEGRLTPEDQSRPPPEWPQHPSSWSAAFDWQRIVPAMWEFRDRILAPERRLREAAERNVKAAREQCAEAEEENDQYRHKLAAAERRAEEAYDKGRAAAFREVLQEFDRRKWAEGGSGAAVREWVDRQRSIAEGKAEG